MVCLSEYMYLIHNDVNNLAGGLGSGCVVQVQQGLPVYLAGEDGKIFPDAAHIHCGCFHKVQRYPRRRTFGKTPGSFLVPHFWEFKAIPQGLKPKPDPNFRKANILVFRFIEEKEHIETPAEVPTGGNVVG